ncbi:MAG: hypothetical protein FJ100_16250 [Deltaproteobacteria bacterium]|nr:hypothetical protein [Deltaproteobacteria bacterium]
MDLRSLVKDGGSPFIGNVVTRNGEFAVRGGFGLVRQYSTTLNGGNVNRVAQDSSFGLGPSIGTFALRTPFGADQVLSVHTVTAFTGDFRTNDQQGGWHAGARAQLIVGLALHVHDLHSGRHFEFVLHDQQAETSQLDTVLPHAATRFDEDHSRWFIPTALPKWATFSTMLGRALILIDGCGVWTYRPVDAPFGPDRKLDSMERAQLGPNYGETCALSPLEIGPGVFLGTGQGDEISYFTAAQFGLPTAMCVMDDRVVYAAGSTLLFSDPNRPDNIMSPNVQFLPTQEEITLLAPVRGMLFVATTTQCWVYTPNTGEALVAKGQLVNISNTMGCLSQRGAVLAESGVFFADRSGIYVYGGGANLAPLSVEIDRLWTDTQSLQLPWTDYYTASGITALADPQPLSRVDVAQQSADFRLAWDDVRKALYCVLDDVALVWTDGFGWSVWTFFSHAGAGAAVQARANLAKPSLVPVRNNVYMVAGPYTLDYTSPLILEECTNSSCGLYLLGRGGALDASADASIEDERQPMGGWVKASQIAPGVGPAMFLGRPIRLPDGYECPAGVIDGESFWLPVSISRGPTGTFNTSYELTFMFDNTRWQPVFTTGVSTEIDFVLPSERLGSADGYAQGAPNPGSSEVQCYLAGFANRAGNQIRIFWDGTLGAWTTKPVMNLGLLGPDLVILLPFRYIGTDSSFSIFEPIAATTAVVSGWFAADVYYWQEGNYPTERTALEARRQPVDWAVKTANLELKGNEFKVRGVFVTAMHLGSASTKVVAGWPFGPLNSATSSDYRDYAGQALDFTQTPPGNSQQTNIQQQQRMMPTSISGNTVPQTVVGNNIARWGDSADATKGNLLIGDAAVDTLATSDGTQGTRASVMLHGTLNAESEGVRVGKVELAVRNVGLRRRWYNR